MPVIAKHTHRFKNNLVRYDKENDRCIIKQIMFNEPMSDYFNDITESSKHMGLLYAEEIESTEYFKNLDNSGQSHI